MLGGAATCFPTSNPNPLAPPWLFPSEWTNDTPDGYRDDYHVYKITQALTLGQTVTSELVTDSNGQCNFYWRGLGVFLFGGAGVPAVRIRDSEGHMMLNSRLVLSNGAPFGSQDNVSPLPVPLRMVPASRLTFDWQEVDGAAGVSVVLYVHGVKRWKL
jgi:hypothetical protein